MKNSHPSRLGLVIALALNTGFLTACGPGFSAAPRIDSDASKLYSNSPAGSKVYLALKSREANVVLNRLMDEAVPSNSGAEPVPQENNVVISGPVCPSWAMSVHTLPAPGAKKNAATCPNAKLAEPPRGWSWLNGSAFVPGLQWEAVGQAQANSNEASGAAEGAPSAEHNYRENIEEHLKAAIAKIEDLITQIEGFDVSTLTQEVQDMKTCLLEHFNQILIKLQDRLTKVQGANAAGGQQPQFTKAQCDQLNTMISDSNTPEVLSQFLKQFVAQRCQTPT